jgi:hypothetical protein
VAVDRHLQRPQQPDPHAPAWLRRDRFHRSHRTFNDAPDRRGFTDLTAFFLRRLFG